MSVCKHMIDTQPLTGHARSTERDENNDYKL